MANQSHTAMRRCCASVLLALSAPAVAQQTAPPPPVRLSGTATLTSDYRHRGISRSDEGLAAQAALEAASDTGFYAGAFASTLDRTRGQPERFGDVQLDLYAGYAAPIGSGVTIDAGLSRSFFPDAPDGRRTDYFEPYASLSYTLGPVTARGGVNYAWDQGAATAGGDLLHVYGQLGAGIPTTPVSVTARLGSAELPETEGRSYRYWSLGATAPLGPVTLGASYVDTSRNGRGERGRIVVSGSVGF